MADIKIAVANSNAVSAPKPSISIATKAAGAQMAKKAETPAKKAPVKKAPAKKAKSSAEYKDVISVSKDGDTASASKESRSKLQESDQANIIETAAKDQATKATDFMYTQIATEELRADLPNDAQVVSQKVTASDTNPYIESLKNGLMEDIRRAQFEQSAERLENIEVNEPKEPTITQAELQERAVQVKAAIQAAQEEPEETFKPQIGSIGSYSDQQLRQLYLEGSISRYSYESEIASRAEQNREFSENEQVFREGIVRNIDNEENAERRASSIENAYDEEASERLTAEQRLEMIGAAEGQLTEE